MLKIFADMLVTWALASLERPRQELKPDPCVAGAMLYQLSYQANWELVIMWMNNKPVGSE